MSAADLKVKEIGGAEYVVAEKLKRSGNGVCPSSDTGQDHQASFVPEEHVLGRSFGPFRPSGQMDRGPLRRIGHKSWIRKRRKRKRIERAQVHGSRLVVINDLFGIQKAYEGKFCHYRP